MADPKLLDIKGLIIEATSYGTDGSAKVVRLVHGVDLSLERGKVLGLIGESGAGKSTIGLSSMGYGRGGVRLSGGSIRLDGQELRTASPADLRKLRGRVVTYVSQSAASSFNPAKRLMGQVIETCLSHKLMSRADATKRAIELFGKLGLPEPEGFGNRYPHQVSGGQLQRAMTAMALCPKPDLVVFDEPTTALDVTTQIGVLAAIKEAIRETGVAALYITHDLAVVAQLADQIMVLRHGRLVEYGETKQIIHAPREEYTRALLHAVPADRGERAPGQPVLHVEGVNARYPNVPLNVLNNINLSVSPGQTLAIVGESGSGKSTLSRVITGLLPAAIGRITFDGHVLSPELAGRSRENCRELQLIYQMADTAMNPRQTVGSTIARPLELYFGMKGAERDRRVVELLDQIEMGKHFANRYPAELSGGEKQRICIARALAAKPKLIICDEVTSALDPLVAEGILNLLCRLQDEAKIAYLFITHDLNTVRSIADQIMVMHKGNVVRYGTKSAVLSPPFDAYTEMLMSSVPQMNEGWLDEKIRAGVAMRSLG